ncbi:helix-turn-helix transcriptional regulator [Neobacillus vireti]|uniref:helix-turn-helix transcriptional regulator n=1 Tax=Neobacillus vireti TaxID=220686 RepID=UPI002FFEB28D
MGKKQTRQVNYEEMKEYGQFFKSMRLSIAYTQKQFARLLDIHYITYGRWELGLIIPQQDIYEIESKVREIVRSVKKVS